MKENQKVILAYLAVCFFWGSTYLAIKIGVQDLAPTVLAGTRFLLAGGLMLAYARVKGLPFPLDRRDAVKNGLVGLLMLLGGNGLVVYAETWVDSGVASLMVSLVPIWVAVIEMGVLRTVRLSPRGYLGLVLGFAGVYLLLRPGSAGGAIDVWGVVIMVIATILWALGSLLSQTVRSRQSLVANIGIQMFVAGSAFLILGGFNGDIARMQFTLVGALSVLYLAVFGSIIGFSSYIYVLQKWPATRASTYAYVNPAVAVFLGRVILDEPLTLTMVLAMGVILFGVYQVQKSKMVIRSR